MDNVKLNMTMGVISQTPVKLNMITGVYAENPVKLNMIDGGFIETSIQLNFINEEAVIDETIFDYTFDFAID